MSCCAVKQLCEILQKSVENGHKANTKDLPATGQVQLSGPRKELDITAALACLLTDVHPLTANVCGLPPAVDIQSPSQLECQLAEQLGQALLLADATAAATVALQEAARLLAGFRDGDADQQLVTIASSQAYAALTLLALATTALKTLVVATPALPSPPPSSSADKGKSQPHQGPTSTRTGVGPASPAPPAPANPTARSSAPATKLPANSGSKSSSTCTSSRRNKKGAKPGTHGLSNGVAAAAPPLKSSGARAGPTATGSRTNRPGGKVGPKVWVTGAAGGKAGPTRDASVAAHAADNAAATSAGSLREQLLQRLTAPDLAITVADVVVMAAAVLGQQHHHEAAAEGAGRCKSCALAACVAASAASATPGVTIHASSGIASGCAANEDGGGTDTTTSNADGSSSTISSSVCVLAASSNLNSLLLGCLAHASGYLYGILWCSYRACTTNSGNSTGGDGSSAATSRSYTCDHFDQQEEPIYGMAATAEAAGFLGGTTATPPSPLSLSAASLDTAMRLAEAMEQSQLLEALSGALLVLPPSPPRPPPPPSPQQEQQQQASPPLSSQQQQQPNSAPQQELPLVRRFIFNVANGLNHLPALAMSLVAPLRAAAAATDGDRPLPSSGRPAHAPFLAAPLLPPPAVLVARRFGRLLLTPSVQRLQRCLLERFVRLEGEGRGEREGGHGGGIEACSSSHSSTCGSGGQAAEGEERGESCAGGWRCGGEEMMSGSAACPALGTVSLTGGAVVVVPDAPGAVSGVGADVIRLTLLQPALSAWSALELLSMGGEADVGGWGSRVSISGCGGGLGTANTTSTSTVSTTTAAVRGPVVMLEGLSRAMWGLSGSYERACCCPETLGRWDGAKAAPGLAAAVVVARCSEGCAADQGLRPAVVATAPTVYDISQQLRPPPYLPEPGRLLRRVALPSAAAAGVCRALQRLSPGAARAVLPAAFGALAAALGAAAHEADAARRAKDASTLASSSRDREALAALAPPFPSSSSSFSSSAACSSSWIAALDGLAADALAVAADGIRGLVTMITSQRTDLLRRLSCTRWLRTLDHLLRLGVEATPVPAAAVTAPSSAVGPSTATAPHHHMRLGACGEEVELAVRSVTPGSSGMEGGISGSGGGGSHGGGRSCVEFVLEVLLLLPPGELLQLTTRAPTAAAAASDGGADTTRGTTHRHGSCTGTGATEDDLAGLLASLGRLARWLGSRIGALSAAAAEAQKGEVGPVLAAAAAAASVGQETLAPGTELGAHPATSGMRAVPVRAQLRDATVLHDKLLAAVETAVSSGLSAAASHSSDVSGGDSRSAARRQQQPVGAVAAAGTAAPPAWSATAGLRQLGMCFPTGSSGSSRSSGSSSSSGDGDTVRASNWSQTGSLEVHPGLLDAAVACCLDACWGAAARLEAAEMLLACDGDGGMVGDGGGGGGGGGGVNGQAVDVDQRPPSPPTPPAMVPPLRRPQKAAAQTRPLAPETPPTLFVGTSDSGNRCSGTAPAAASAAAAVSITASGAKGAEAAIAGIVSEAAQEVVAGEVEDDAAAAVAAATLCARWLSSPPLTTGLGAAAGAPDESATSAVWVAQVPDVAKVVYRLLGATCRLLVGRATAAAGAPGLCYGCSLECGSPGEIGCLEGDGSGGGVGNTAEGRRELGPLRCCAQAVVEALASIVGNPQLRGVVGNWQLHAGLRGDASSSACSGSRRRTDSGNLGGARSDGDAGSAGAAGCGGGEWLYGTSSDDDSCSSRRCPGCRCARSTPAADDGGRSAVPCFAFHDPGGAAARDSSSGGGGGVFSLPADLAALAAAMEGPLGMASEAATLKQLLLAVQTSACCQSQRYDPPQRYRHAADPGEFELGFGGGGGNEGKVDAGGGGGGGWQGPLRAWRRYQRQFLGPGHTGAVPHACGVGEWEPAYSMLLGCGTGTASSASSTRVDPTGGSKGSSSAVDGAGEEDEEEAGGDGDTAGRETGGSVGKVAGPRTSAAAPSDNGDLASSEPVRGRSQVAGVGAPAAACGGSDGNEEGDSVPALLARAGSLLAVLRAQLYATVPGR